MPNQTKKPNKNWDKRANEIWLQFESVYHSNRLSGNKLTKIEVFKAVLPEILKEEHSQTLQALKKDLEDILEEYRIEASGVTLEEKLIKLIEAKLK